MNTNDKTLLRVPGSGEFTSSYVVELLPGYPVSKNFETDLRAVLARNGAPAAPDAFYWDDALLRRVRRFDIRPCALRWPDPEPYLAGQVSFAGRCAVREDLLARLHGEGRIPSASDTTAAIAVLSADPGAALCKLDRVYRLVHRDDDPIYRPSRIPEPPVQASSVSVIVNYRDRPDLVESCLRSLADQTVSADVEIILIDNQSRPESRAKVEQDAEEIIAGLGRVRHFDYDAPFNKSAQDNMGAKAATGEVVVFMNNDARLVDATVLQSVADWAMTPGVATVGPRFVGRSGRLVSSGVQIVPPRHGRPPVIRESEIVPLSRTVHFSAGASLAFAGIRRQLWLDMGGMDEQVFTAQYNDADFDIRALDRGLKHLYLGHVTAHHEPGRSEQRTVEMVLALRRKLIARYPHMGVHGGLDPDLVFLKRMPDFGDPRLELMTAVAKLITALGTAFQAVRNVARSAFMRGRSGIL